MYDANFKIVMFGDETEAKRNLTNKYILADGLKPREK